MNSRLFNARDEHQEWNTALLKLPATYRDIYFCAEYVTLHSLPAQTEPLLFVFSDDGNQWFYPFIKQPIRRIGNNHFDEHRWYDISSAYGYGGPLTTTEDPAFLAAAHAAFNQWANDNGIVAEFVRFHPLIGNAAWVDADTVVIPERETVSINLENTESSGIQLSSEARYMTRRAEASGISVVKHDPSVQFGRFVSLYKDTMRRVNAIDYYFFNSEYFELLQKLICNHGYLFVAERDGTWVAASLFMKGAKYLHYHLSATDPQMRVPGATNALIAAAAYEGQKEQLIRLHLGGGRTAASKDSLLKFKLSMGTDRHSFKIGKRIRNREAYSALCDLWRKEFPSLVPAFGSRILCYKENLDQTN